MDELAMIELADVQARQAEGSRGLGDWGSTLTYGFIDTKPPATKPWYLTEDLYRLWKTHYYNRTGDSTIWGVKQEVPYEVATGQKVNVWGSKVEPKQVEPTKAQEITPDKPLPPLIVFPGDEDVSPSQPEVPQTPVVDKPVSGGVATPEPMKLPWTEYTPYIVAGALFLGVVVLAVRK